MNIGIDGSRAFIKGRTGTENYSYQVIRNMSSIDTENSYLIYITKSQESRVKSLDWPGNFEFRVISLARLWTQVGLALRTFIDPLDVLFVPSHTLPLFRRPGLKTVITVHDLGAEYLPELHQLKQILYLKLMTHYQIKTATKVIGVSEATKNDLVKRVGIKRGKVEVIYEGVDKNIFKLIENDVLNNILIGLNLRKNNYFLFVGTVQPRKNIERIIKAFALFSADKLGYMLVLAGGKGWKTDEIYKLPAQLGIKDQVRFLGRVRDEELVGLYNGAVGLVYPSLFEGFGLPIVEAFACGCPVITSNSSSMPEVAGDGAILVDPENVDEIYSAMKRITEDDVLRLSLIKKGILRLGKFDWKDAAARTIEVLTQAGR